MKIHDVECHIVLLVPCELKVVCTLQIVQLVVIESES